MAGPKILIASAGLLALTACSDGNIVKGFYSEAGYWLDEGGFGNPTMNNHLAQLASRCASHLGKGQVLYEPKVVRAPVGAPAPYVAKVHCGGYLNGKYAEVIFREYVESATEMPPRNTSGGDGLGG